MPIPRSSAGSDRDWTHVIYAHVLIQMLEDLRRDDEHQAAALNWFASELREVALVSLLCRVPALDVYRVVVETLHGQGQRARKINRIRRMIRRGEKLSAMV